VSPRPGDRVRVTDGPYTGWPGEVVVVVIAVFAKPTAIDLLPSQIALVN
jgi:hypothetical protein